MHRSGLLALASLPYPLSLVVCHDAGRDLLIKVAELVPRHPGRVNGRPAAVAAAVEKQQAAASGSGAGSKQQQKKKGRKK